MALTRSHVEPRSDAELLLAAERDSAAFAEVYERHAPLVYRWLERRIGWLAADLTAETFARAWIHRARFRDDRDGSAAPWLLGIAGRLVADAARRDRVETRARERLGLSPFVAEDDQEAVERRLSPRLELQRCLAELPAHEREAIDLRVIGEMSYDEVARRLNIRPAAARLRVSRGLGRLRRTVLKEEW